MKTLKIILAGTCLFLFGCENFTWFQSEGTVNKQIQGTWKREFLRIIDQHEEWTFKDGKINVIRYDLQDTCVGYYCDQGIRDVNFFDKNDTILLDTGNYNVDAKIDKVFLKTTDFKASQPENNYNHKWTIVEIDGEILYIAADGTDDIGVVQREFVKKQ